MTLEIVRELSSTDVTDLLRHAKVRFVVDDAGILDWVALEECYAFWKSEVKVRLVNPVMAETGFYLEDFPGAYCYLAMECTPMGNNPVVLLRKFH